jgi:hypothetical protein
VPARSIDELLDAMRTVEILQEAVRNQHKAIELVVDRLARVERRLEILEAASGKTRP